jgi:acyl-CoA synthetase (AMP-forming)/AMP-acid ligase II
VAVYKRPEYLLPLDSLPRNAVGKILKRERRERARAHGLGDPHQEISV